MYDCIVCGGGPSGLAASISASRNGSKVLLIESSGILGGTNTLSLVGPLMTYHNQLKLIIGGIANEIVERLNKVQGTLGHIPDPLDFCSTVTPIDTESLKQLYFDLIEENKVDLLLHTMVVGVEKEGKLIKSIKVANKTGITSYSAKTYIDATGDGDLCSFAGCQFELGRSQDHLCQPMTMPFVVGNVNLDLIKEAMKNDPDNFVLADNYDYKYVGVSGFFKEVALAKKNNDFSVNRDRVLLFENVKKNEVTINMTRVLKYNPLNPYERTLAEIEGRKQVYETLKFLKKYIPGFKDSYLIATPYQIGIRESRHIKCCYMMTKEDIVNLQKFEDSICLGAFPMDIHSPTGSDMCLEELANDKCYEIPLRSILPVDIDNIIVTGRAIGASHEAAASIRVSPVAMALGEVSGALCSLSTKMNQMPKDVDYKVLQQLLVKNGCLIKK